MTAKSIDEYISTSPDRIKTRLSKVREIVKRNAPHAEEAISYGIPTFRLNGNLVHFAGCNNHIGFYTTPSGMEAFKEQIAQYESAKGSVKFPLSEPLPEKLIAEIVKYRVEENKLKK